MKKKKSEDKMCLDNDPDGNRELKLDTGNHYSKVLYRQPQILNIIAKFYLIMWQDVAFSGIKTEFSWQHFFKVVIKIVSQIS